MKKIILLLLVSLCAMNIYAHPHDRFNRHWRIGGNLNNEGYQIFHRGRLVDGRAMKLVIHDRRPWVINRLGMIFQRRDGRWIKMPGVAVDITVSRDNRVWVIGTASPNIAGQPIYYWKDDRWQQVAGSGVRFVSRPHEAVKVINQEGMIFVWRDGRFIYLRSR